MSEFAPLIKFLLGVAIALGVIYVLVLLAVVISIIYVIIKD